MKCEGTTKTVRRGVDGELLAVDFVGDCDNDATWRVEYLTGAAHLVCDSCVSPCTVIPLTRKAGRL